MNPRLRNIVLGAPRVSPAPVIDSPYYIECMADFNWPGSATPEGLADYADGNYCLNVTGTAGDSFVTVVGGDDIADAGAARAWAAVLKDDAGVYTPRYVTGTSGDTVSFFPALEANITAGVLSNLHDSSMGQHYSELGSFALAQHIYNASPRYAKKETFIKKVKGTDASGWTGINAGVQYQIGGNISGINGVSYLVRYSTTYADMYCSSVGSTTGCKQSVNVAGKSGYLETFVGVDNAGIPLVAEFYLDDVLVDRREDMHSAVHRLVFPFSGATTAEIRLFIEGVPYTCEFSVGDTTWWLDRPITLPSKIIPSTAKLVWLGDSWGVAQTAAVVRELARLMGVDSTTIVNPSSGGKTSAWGKAWFDQYVLSVKPTHVIIEFFVNDFNSTGGTLGNFTAPDSSSISLDVTKTTWRENIREMIAWAIAAGVQPIIVCPCATGSGTQTQGLAIWNVYISEGTIAT